jgi:hypothetical protein
MFNKDFYPTTPELLKQMVAGEDLSGKIVLDPESGKADIIKFVQKLGAKALGCEIDKELYKISESYAEMIGRDFLLLTKADVSHVDYIIMNPPFSADIKHIRHAWEIAPDGCKVIALCNSDTLKLERLQIKKLNRIIDEFGSIEEMGQPFTIAERKTKVNVALIRLNKPEVEQEDWSKYFEYEVIDEGNDPGIVSHDIVTEIVGRYVGSLKMFKKVDELSGEINSMMSSINTNSISFGCTMRDRNRGDTVHLSYETFKTSLQKSAWQSVFNVMNMDRFMTEKLKERINKFVEEQSENPFTRRNIYNMMQFVYDSNAGRMDEVLIEVFDLLTQHHHDNRFNVEGWKTNSHYMINKKIIIPYMVNLRSGGGIDINYRGASKVEDLVKALCYITGTDYDSVGHLESWSRCERIKDPEYYRNDEYTINKIKREYKHYSKHWDFAENFNAKYRDEEHHFEESMLKAIEKQDATVRREFGKWHDWGFFEVKGFKKGTMHLKFKDEEVWKMFNKRVADIKGLVLPEALRPKEEVQPKHEPKVNENQFLLNI